MKYSFFEGKEVMLGIYVTSDFLNSDEQALIAYKGAIKGGHAVIMIGWDNSIKCLKIMNSWGETWGDKGFLWLSYDYVEKALIYSWAII